jgi:hypothetical protein
LAWWATYHLRFPTYRINKIGFPVEVNMANDSEEKIAEQRNARLSIPIPTVLATALASAARAEDRSVASWVRNALKAALRADEMRKFSQR